MLYYPLVQTCANVIARLLLLGFPLCTGMLYEYASCTGVGNAPIDIEFLARTPTRGDVWRTQFACPRRCFDHTVMLED